MMFDLNNKIVLITGAAEGIGAAVVSCLLDENVKHVAILDVAIESGIALQNVMNNKYGINRVKFYKCDVTKDDELFGAFAETKDTYGYIDVVINNAALMNDSPLCYKKEIEVNYTALVTSTLKAFDLMRIDQGGKGGTVVNVSSVASLIQSPITPIYYGTKSAVLHFSCCIGLPEYYDTTGVRVITVCFNKTDTALLSKQKFGSLDATLENNFGKYLESFKGQSKESAARALVQACKLGRSGSVWFSGQNQTAEDITPTVKEAYGIMTRSAHVHM